MVSDLILAGVVIFSPDNNKSYGRGIHVGAGSVNHLGSGWGAGYHNDGGGDNGLVVSTRCGDGVGYGLGSSGVTASPVFVTAIPEKEVLYFRCAQGGVA